ncbi:MAG: class I SAM-dependent methyltransferase [Acidimicrobiia bacterium]|nr:class I SAM-dependent methyltransferase [Acidimicrobiia bacterium]
MTDTRDASGARTFIRGMWTDVAPAWGRNADEIDERAAPITQRMLTGAALRPSDRVLELASGPGGAGVAAAGMVGDEGVVVISDVVPEMVEIAAARAAARGATNVRTAVLDLEDIAEPDHSFDVVLCREGMMFAVDPARAAREMRRVLVPGGRASVAVWAEREENPWLGVLFDAIAEVTGVVVPPPGMPGPFALGDADFFQQLLLDAGFTDLRLERIDAPLRVASFDAWWARNLTVAGPVVGILNGLDDATRGQLQAHLRHALEPYASDQGLELPGVALLLCGRTGS